MFQRLMILAFSLGIALGSLAISEPVFGQTSWSVAGQAGQGTAQTQFEQGSEAYKRDDYAEAVRLWQLAALSGHMDAQLAVAHHYEYGMGITKSNDKALYWYDKAAAQGSDMARDRAETLLIRLKNEGVVSKGFEAYNKGDYAQALQFWQSISGSNPSAQYNIGVLYNEGQGVPKSYDKATEWFKKSAVWGYDVAQFALGHQYEYGKGVKQSRDKAVEWYSKAAAQGHEDAKARVDFLKNASSDQQSVLRDMTSAADAYENQDYSKAQTLWLRAANRGDPLAMHHLGWMHESGKVGDRDYESAAQWYKKAATLGLPEGSYRIAELYYRGDGVQKSKDKALEFYLKAAKQGMPKSMYTLGYRLIESGRIKEGYDWINKAARRDDANALFYLAGAYQMGKGDHNERYLEQSFAQSKYYYSRMADIGNSTGMYYLGLAYARGEGVPKSKAMAQHWFLKAARLGDTGGTMALNESNRRLLEAETLSNLQSEAAKGNVTAQLELGQAYLNGTYGNRSASLARHWLNKAANSGNEMARINLAEMAIRGADGARDLRAAKDQLLAIIRRDTIHPSNFVNTVKALQAEDADIAEPVFAALADHAQSGPEFLVEAGLFFRDRNSYTKDSSKKPEYRSRHLRYLTRAAEQGSMRAMFFMGAAYSDKDDVKARYWYGKGAEAGDWLSMRHLGGMYEQGRGGSRDFNKAIKLYEQAAANGDERGQSYANFARRQKAAYDRAAADKSAANVKVPATNRQTAAQEAEQRRQQDARRRATYYKPKKEKCGWGCWLVQRSMASSGSYYAGSTSSSSSGGYSSYGSTSSQPYRELTYKQFHNQQWLKSPSNYYQNRYTY